MARRKQVVQLFNGNRVPSKRDQTRSVTTSEILEEAGFHVTTISPYPRPWNPFAHMHNAYRGLDPLRAIMVLFKERNADLICAHLESGALLVLLRKLTFFRPPVLIWEVPWSPGWRFRDYVLRLVVPRADCCVVFSTNQIALLEAMFGRSINVRFVPFYVDTEWFLPQACEAEYIWSCGLDPGRDFETLIEACRPINASVRIKTSSHFKLDSRELPRVTQEIAYLSPEIFRDRYARASIVVICTKATPNASGITSLLEGLSMGRPVIASDNPALRDYLPPSDSCIVVPVGDVAALRNAILHLLQNPELAEEMGRKGRKYVEQRFSKKVHEHAMSQLFDDVISKN